MESRPPRAGGSGQNSERVHCFLCARLPALLCCLPMRLPCYCPILCVLCPYCLCQRCRNATRITPVSLLPSLALLIGTSALPGVASLQPFPSSYLSRFPVVNGVMGLVLLMVWNIGCQSGSPSSGRSPPPSAGFAGRTPPTTNTITIITYVTTL